MTQSIITEKLGDITDIRYSAEANIYCSEHPSVFPHILLKDVVNVFSLSSEIKRLLCAVVVVASCLLSSDKKELNTA